MRQRELGYSGLRVSAFGLGWMGISEFYGRRNKAGVSFLDTADMYRIGSQMQALNRRCGHGVV
jgi:aryl-alcohol dehydrogenase-like predicted oxidoreductase